MEIACKYSSNDDVLLWTNSDIIFFQELVTSIKNIVPLLDKDYLLIGKRLNWMNPNSHFNLTVVMMTSNDIL